MNQKVKTAQGNCYAPLTLNTPCLTLTRRTSVFSFAIAAGSRALRITFFPHPGGVNYLWPRVSAAPPGGRVLMDISGAPALSLVVFGLHVPHGGILLY